MSPVNSVSTALSDPREQPLNEHNNLEKRKKLLLDGRRELLEIEFSTKIRSSEMNYPSGFVIFLRLGVASDTEKGNPNRHSIATQELVALHGRRDHLCGTEIIIGG